MADPEDETTDEDVDLDEADEADEATDGDEADEPADGDTPAPTRRGLDGRTLAICALVAVIAALLAGFVTSKLTADDDDPAAQTDLSLAEEVPDLDLPVLGTDDGGEISLADYRGQPVVVNFWGSWCVPCVEEMPDLQAVHESLGDQVAFVGINVNDAEEAAEAMAETTGVTYDLVRDEGGELVRALEVTNFPTTFLVDADGTIVDVARRQISSERLCEKINQSLLNRSLEECG